MCTLVIEGKYELDRVRKRGMKEHGYVVDLAEGMEGGHAKDAVLQVADQKGDTVGHEVRRSEWLEDGGHMNQAASVVFVVAVLGAALLSGCGAGSIPASTPAAVATHQGQSSPISGSRTEQPVLPERNPPGDIPDNQVFISFTSTVGGYTIEIPEGWARTTNGANTRFTDKLDGVQVVLTDAANEPTVASARTNEVAVLEQSGRAVQITKVQDVQLPGGKAVSVEYSSNSEPDSITGKQVRLENNAYLFFRSGKLATLTLWAPFGADNVDQWQQMARSFRWQ